LQTGKPSIALLFTTFPKTSETFLQREVKALQARGLPLRPFWLWGGGGDFNGLRVETFSKWELLPLFLFIIPWNFLRRPRLLRDLCEGVLTRPAPSWLNFWENMLGAGFAGCFYWRMRRDPPALVHAAWSGGPATAAWCLWRMFGWRYSVGAHAYDLYEHGGDWWLREKLAHAVFVQTSTEMGRATLLERGVPPEKIHVIRRGLETFPGCKPLRSPRRPLRVVCVARLVPKKGLHRQLRIYAALREAGVPFEVRMVGDGPLRTELELLVAQLNLGHEVKLLGQRPSAEVWEHYAWADVLVHTGVVAESGDRDGLANVIPEAMAAGVLVVTTPTSASTEAVQHERTGLVADIDRQADWVDALRRLATDDALAEKLRLAARRWTEENYDAHKNTARLADLFAQAMSR
jgi:glycosyltransferase involved in cell wall biosynthesis